MLIFESFNEIHSLCKEYDINNYTINDDGSINVNGNVYLSFRKLTELPLNFNEVNGEFDCSNNKLTTLKGCPKEVPNDFHCNSNKLTTLEGGPEYVGGYYDCGDNHLTTLKGSPKEIGQSFQCYNNLLKTLEDAPLKVNGHIFNALNNPIYTLEGFETKGFDEFYCTGPLSIFRLGQTNYETIQDFKIINPIRKDKKVFKWKLDLYYENGKVFNIPTKGEIESQGYTLI